jgi:hypothetical protein
VAKIKAMTTVADQCPVVRTTVSAIMRDPNFRRGVADYRRGIRPDFDVDDGYWAYERGRQWASIAPRDMPVTLPNERTLNPKAVQLFKSHNEYIR